MSDIIDNREHKLAEQIRTILESSEAAHFAVGYFFISGFTAIADRLDNIKSLRLLIGNTSNRQTIDQIAQGYRHLELIEERLKDEAYPNHSSIPPMIRDAATHISQSIELMDQTEINQALVQKLVAMIESGRLQVKIYTKGVLHAKAYIFDYGQVFDEKGKEIARAEAGIGIVGSSNLSLSGISHNTELNVVIHGNNNHLELKDWFEKLWDEGEDFDRDLMREMKKSWAVTLASPYDIYMKTLYHLVRGRLENDDIPKLILNDSMSDQLADFQAIAVQHAIQNIRNYGGSFVSDVVGLGKSFIGAAIIKRMEQLEGTKALIICPPPLMKMWADYNDRYQLNAQILSMGQLKDNSNLLEDARYRDRDFILIDESHNLCNHSTQRYEAMVALLAGDKRCCLLTATPRNKSAWDIYHQIKLFHPDDQTDRPELPSNLKEYFKLVEAGQKPLSELLSHILIRRTRNHILRFYGFDSHTHKSVDPTNFAPYLQGKQRAYVKVGGKHRFFPKRELETIEYSIEDTYNGLYDELRQYLGRANRQPGIAPPGELCYARYGLGNYVLPAQRNQEAYRNLQQAGANLRGLIRVLLFKRFESSVHAFRTTIDRQITTHQRFLAALGRGFIPAGKDAQKLLVTEIGGNEEADLTEAIERVSGKYNIADFDADALIRDIQADLNVLLKIRTLVEPITPDRDAKLQTLKAKLTTPLLKSKKRLIFTQYADTAQYLYDNLQAEHTANNLEVIHSGNDRDKTQIVARFAPKANPDTYIEPGTELQTLIATDILAEGLNLQDGDAIINYDLHWNPVKLIQRFGRIDRIGSEKDVIYGFNFLPERNLERNLGLQQVLQARIKEIHDSIGEDSAILDRSEQLNEKAMYAIYEQQGEQLDELDPADADMEFLDLNEAEEILRRIQKDNPAEFDRIKHLPNGIRSAKLGTQSGTFVFCEAVQPNQPQQKGDRQLFLVDNNGEIISRDLAHILAAISAHKTTPTATLPANYNRAVMAVLRIFKAEVRERAAEQKQLQLSQAQRYVLRELGWLFKATDDLDLQAKISILDRAFQGRISRGVDREINALKQHGVNGEALFSELVTIYNQHHLSKVRELDRSNDDSPVVSTIICSEAISML